MLKCLFEAQKVSSFHTITGYIWSLFDYFVYLFLLAMDWNSFDLNKLQASVGHANIFSQSPCLPSHLSFLLKEFISVYKLHHLKFFNKISKIPDPFSFLYRRISCHMCENKQYQNRIAFQGCNFSHHWFHSYRKKMFKTYKHFWFLPLLEENILYIILLPIKILDCLKSQMISKGTQRNRSFVPPSPTVFIRFTSAESKFTWC